MTMADQHLWAEPEVRPSAGDLMDENDWATNVSKSLDLLPVDTSWSDTFFSLAVSHSHDAISSERSSLEWYLECSLLGNEMLRNVVQIDPDRHGGVPVLKG